jgi:hypothetical protein
VAVGKGKWHEVQEKLRGAQEKRLEAARLEAAQAQNAVYAGLLDEARAGSERGAPFFSCSLTEVANDTSHAAFLGSAEELGWRLGHVSHVYVPKESSTFGSESGASQSTHSGVLRVYYLFRRL